jgi:hypothetical protein
MPVSVMQALISQFAMPLVSSIIRAHFNATGNLPTEAEIIAALPKDAATYSALGQAFLNQTPLAPPA